ncbi:MAG TPA: hypothetical protein VFC07_04620 [Verrucomicrobiae bacterium]|nr:hypothetical protein [Verrucomicrobiae bacterium]
MMKIFGRFNIYLCLALGLLFAGGCQTPAEKEKKQKEKDITLIELHMEVNRDGATDNEPVAINRDPPIYVNVDKSPFVDASDITEAVLVEELGGFGIRLKFNWRGTQLLEGMTTANRGKRIAVFCTFGPARWIASPVIQRRISDGVFTFAPDASRTEAERIVRGLNNSAKKLKKDDTW